MNLANLFSVKDLNICITGASSGIGAALAQHLAALGANSILVARREAELAAKVEQIKSDGHSANYVVADLLSQEGIEKAANDVTQAFGTVDVLISAAGVNLREPTEEISFDSWNQTLDINLRTPFFLAKELVPAMQAKGWGRIINIASLQTQRAFPNGLAYGASKGGVGQLTRAMAQSWSQDGINCNAIAPGFFKTELTESVFDNPAAVEKLAKQTCVGRNGELEDLVGTTVFLASKASDYVTGQVIYVDGGFTAK